MSNVPPSTVELATLNNRTTIGRMRGTTGTTTSGGGIISSSSSTTTIASTATPTTSFPLLKRSLSLFSSPITTPTGSPWIRKPLSVVHSQQQQQESSLQMNHNDNSDPYNNAHHQAQQLQRHLSVWDLIGIGVGGTVGSGIFVLTGQIAAQYSGPGTAISFLLAGMAATCSGVCYAELSARIPAAGSTYVYAYICWGELPAVIAAACLTLEYGVAGAAVARTWGDKITDWLIQAFATRTSSSSLADMITNTTIISNNDDDEPASTRIIESILAPWDGAVNVPALIITVISTLLLLGGVSESKAVMNFVTSVKMILVAIMIVGGFYYYDPKNMPPSVPLAPYGVAGLLRGSTTSFFAFLGYDEVCCLAGEAKHPVRDLPRAVLGTLAIVTLCYILASIALAGMVPYDEISPTSGFPAAFMTRNATLLGAITAIGEICTLPVVVVISLMAQPRIFYGMAQDGLVPAFFGNVDPVTGNLYAGTAISGIGMTIIAAVVPFTYLDDLISAGILVAFCITDSCLILLRCKKRDDTPMVGDGLLTSSSSSSSLIESSWLLEMLLLFYNALCFITAILWTHTIFRSSKLQTFLAILSTSSVFCCFVYLKHTCPPTSYFGGSILAAGETDRHIPQAVITTPESRGGSFRDQHGNNQQQNKQQNRRRSPSEKDYFHTPAVPALPCIGMAINWYLIAQLEVSGILLLGLFLFLVIVLYGITCAPNSVGHLRNWSLPPMQSSRSSSSNTHHYEFVTTTDDGLIESSYQNNSPPLPSDHHHIGKIEDNNKLRPDGDDEDDGEYDDHHLLRQTQIRKHRSGGSRKGFPRTKSF